MAGTFAQFAQPNPWGLSPFGAHGIGVQPGGAPFSGYASLSQSAIPPVQQLIQLLQTVPQQLQHLAQLAHIQQQQTQYLLQSLPHQLQQLQLQLLAQSGSQAGISPQAYGSPFQQGLSQPFGAQPGQIM